MRTLVMTAVLPWGLVLLSATAAGAGERLHYAAGCDQCGSAPCHHPHLFDHLFGCWPCCIPGMCGMDDWSNCNCNGSYKFPVPPQYTYHWPGMYSQQLMTDYQSPWRYPPLKPYFDEPSPGEAQPYPGLLEGEELEEEAVEEAAPESTPAQPTRPTARRSRLPRNTPRTINGALPASYRR
jgi:hypothetical protein